MNFKRWIWLAVLPWAVVVSTGHKTSYSKEDKACALIYNGGKDGALITVGGTYVTYGWCEGLQDLAAAMNEAHYRRQTKVLYPECENGSLATIACTEALREDRTK